MKIAIAQVNPIIADIKGNKDKIISYIESAISQKADIVIFPEMATIGYPPLDLLENKKIIQDNLMSLEDIAKKSKNIAIICGYVDYDSDNPPMLFNSAAFLENGKIISKHNKTQLSPYDIFNEFKYFTPAGEYQIINFNGKKIGIVICEDIWNTADIDQVSLLNKKKYSLNPVKTLVDMNADLIVNISASPYVQGEIPFRRKILSEIAQKNSVSIVYVNQVGGNDSLIFDGNSLYINKKGKITGHAKGFEENLLIVDDESNNEIDIPCNELEEVRKALVLGLRDYVYKCGFKKAVIGLSGGIDSSLTAVLAVEALGPENVLGVSMPSIYSSKGSVNDANSLAKNLSIKIDKIPIKKLFSQYKDDLKKLFNGMPEDITEENIQARIRSALLMAISNKTGSLLLATGNKSEAEMGYCTLYGDMSGGLAVISDLYKTMVYNLARHINSETEIIPIEIIEKPPSAELKENQKDEDSLPPYELLDRILELYIEQRKSSGEIIAGGYSDKLVREVIYNVNQNEFKKRQAAPGLKVTSKAFTAGMRIPMAQKFIP